MPEQSPLSIREAARADASALHELYMKHLTSYPPQEPQDLAQWADLLGQLIANPDYHLIIGEIDNLAVSSVTLVIIRNLTHNLRPYAVIENVVTHGDFRNRGFATALMKKAEEIARANNCYKIMLMTGSKKESTLCFYESCGYNRNDKTAFLLRLK
jgi:GNAT superfamily N-acetyltransferase